MNIDELMNMNYEQKPLILLEFAGWNSSRAAIHIYIYTISIHLSSHLFDWNQDP